MRYACRFPFQDVLCSLLSYLSLTMRESYNDGSRTNRNTFGVLRPDLQFGKRLSTFQPLASDFSSGDDGFTHGIEDLHTKASQALHDPGQANKLANRAFPHSLEEDVVGIHLWRAGLLGILRVVMDRVEVAIGSCLHD